MRGAGRDTEARVTDPEVTDVPSSTHRDTPPAAPPSPPAAPRPPIDGPPPPPAGPGSDAESRATAAAWVAAVGAALLLAAAGTFLAVSWDALGLTARVAVVASVTGAAILGGQRLRRVLPAVGAVVFHLGALLVPVDALGLAHQLDANVAVRWAAVGLTATLVMPVLAVVGRSRVLGLVGLVGLPVTATAAGIGGYTHPAIVLAGLALVATALEVARVERRPERVAATGGAFALDGPLGPARRAAAPWLASLAVMVPWSSPRSRDWRDRGRCSGARQGAGWRRAGWSRPWSVPRPSGPWPSPRPTDATPGSPAWHSPAPWCRAC